MRKVIQIIASDEQGIFALCDDGKMFRFDSLNREWIEFEKVPQPGEGTPARRR